MLRLTEQMPSLSQQIFEKKRVRYFSSMICILVLFTTLFEGVQSDCVPSDQLLKGNKHGSAVVSISMTSDYKYVTTTQVNGITKIWSFNSKELTFIQTFNFKEKLLFSQNVFMWNDGAKLFVGGSSGIVKVLEWNPTSKNYVLNPRTITFPYAITTIWVTKNGTVYVGMDNAILGIQRAYWSNNQWVIQNIPNISNSYQTVTSIKFSRDQQKMFIGTYLKAICILINNQGTYIQDQCLNQSLTSINISPDQRYITVNGIAKQFNVYMLNKTSGKYVSISRPPIDTVSDMTYGTFVDLNNFYMVALPNIASILRYYIYTINGISTFIPYDKWEIKNTTGPWSTFSQVQTKFFFAGTKDSIFLISCDCVANVASNCLTCVGYQCNQCQKGFLLANGKCQNCIDGYYKMNGACLQCPPNCEKCSNEGGCSSCKTGYSLSSQNCTLCAVGYFKNNGICISCPFNCQSCAQNRGCSSCKAGYVQPSENCYSCAANYYKSNNFCVACPNRCTVCSDGIGCSTCNIAYSLVNGTCNTCALNYFKINDQDCIACNNNCLTCLDKTGCMTCKQGYFSPVNNCSMCAPNYFKFSDSCISCPINCLICRDQSGCTSCQPGYTLLGGNCNTCASNYYKTSNTTCVACPLNCATCQDGIGCSACQVGFLLGKNVCLSCPTKCDLCTSQTSCSKCSNNYVLNNGKCCVIGTDVCNADSTSSTCLSRYYLNLNNRLCTPCGQYCSSCNATTCFQCEYGYSFKSMYRNSRTDVLCLSDSDCSYVPNCNVYNFSQQTGLQCYQCKNIAALRNVLKNDKLISQCVLNTVFVAIGPQCQVYIPVQQSHRCYNCSSTFLLLPIYDPVIALTSTQCISKTFTIYLIQNCLSYISKGSPTYYECYACNNGFGFGFVESLSQNSRKCIRNSSLLSNPNCQILTAIYRQGTVYYQCLSCFSYASFKPVNQVGTQIIQECVWLNVSSKNLGCGAYYRYSDTFHYCKYCSSITEFKTVFRNNQNGPQCVPLTVIQSGPSKCNVYMPTINSYTCYRCVLGYTLKKLSINDNIINQCLLNKDISQVFYCDIYQKINEILSCKSCFPGFSPKPVQPPSLATNIQECVLDSIIKLNDGCIVFERILKIHQCKQCLPGMSLKRVYRNQTLVNQCILDVITAPFSNCYAFVPALYSNYICHACENGYSLLTINKTQTTISQQCILNNITKFVQNCYTYNKKNGSYQCTSCTLGRTIKYFLRNNTNVIDCALNTLLETIFNCQLYLELPNQYTCVICSKNFQLKIVDRNRPNYNQNQCILSSLVTDFNRCSVLIPDGLTLACKSCEIGFVMISIYRNGQTDKTCVLPNLLPSLDKCDTYRLNERGIITCFFCKPEFTANGNIEDLKCS